MKKEKQTIQEKVENIHVRRPGLLYWIIGIFWQLLFKHKYNAHYYYKVNLKKIKGPYIVVSNHATRVDYMFSALAFFPIRLNHVVGYNEFFRSHLKFIMKVMQCIPKRNFTSDIHAVKEMMRVLDKKGVLMLYPEGMSSISGANQPVALGSGKFIKHCKVPVLFTKIEGGYLENTKNCLDERKGRVDVTIDQLFTVEDIEKLTADEIQDKLNEVLYHDAFEWNKKERVAFDGKGRIAHNLHQLLYWCPKCGHELKMRGEQNTIKCNHCGNGAIINEYYDFIPFDSTCVIPETQTKWWNMERQNEHDRVKDPNFELKEHVKLGILPPDHYLTNFDTSEIVGEGELVLNHKGLTYTGTKNNEEFSFFIDTKNLPTYGMCTDCSRFYTFFEKEFYEFYPESESVAKWLLSTEEIHRINGGKWQDFKNTTIK